MSSSDDRPPYEPPKIYRLWHFLRNFWLMNRAVVSIIFLLLVGSGIFFYLNSKTSVDNGQSLRPTASSVTELKLEEFYKLYESDVLQNQSSRKDRYRKALAIAKEIDELDDLNNLRPADIDAFKTAKLNILAEQAAVAKRDKLPDVDQYWQDLHNFADELIESDNKFLTMKAHAILCSCYSIPFELEPNEANAEELRKQFRESIPALLTGEKKTLIQVATYVAKFGDKIEAKNDLQYEVTEEVGDLFKSTSNSDYWQLGALIHDKLILRGRDIDKLCEDVGFAEKDAMLELGNFIVEVTQSQRPSQRLYWLAFKAINAIDRQALDGFNSSNIIGRISTAIPLISREQVRKSAETYLKHYTQLKTGIHGHQLDLNIFCEGAQPTEAEQDLLGRFAGKRIVILFADNSDYSRSFSQPLLNYRRTLPAHDETQFIYVMTPTPDFESVLPSSKRIDPTSFQSLLTNSVGSTSGVARAQAQRLLAEIPVSAAPYLVLLDSEHRIAQTNLNPRELRTILD